MPAAAPDIVVELTQLMDKHARGQYELLVEFRQIRASLTDQEPVRAGLTGSQTVLDHWQREVLGSDVRPTSHDYDYFGELDRRLLQFTRR